MIASYYN